MKNKEAYVLTELDFKEAYATETIGGIKDRTYYDIIDKNTNTKICTINVPKGEEKLLTVLNWFEQEKDCLTEDERNYLKVVIEPFRERVHSICRMKDKIDNCALAVLIDDDFMTIPLFKSGKCSGMELDKPYTLEELGI